MTPFRFWRDPLCLAGCAAYALNRWILERHLSAPFLHAHFDDLWLIPCALPLILYVHRLLRWRAATPPSAAEVAGHLLLWSILFEWVGPHLLPGTVGDGWDVVCYWVGGAAAWLWWNRASLRPWWPARVAP